ncbi:MAG: hypothetical protein NE328_24610 [Lentisphaeraceae bacterium]|nr:hypothetical protein [Lentisphaeraceae bacterium]
MNKVENILIIDSNSSSSANALEQLELHGYKVQILSSCSEALVWLPDHNCDVILFDFHCELSSEIDFMTWVKAYKNEISIFAMIENIEAFEETRVYCENAGNIPLFCKQFAVLEAIDHLERVKRAS